MPTKAELRAEAEAKGIDVPDDATKAEIEALLVPPKPDFMAKDSRDESEVSPNVGWNRTVPPAFGLLSDNGSEVVPKVVDLPFLRPERDLVVWKAATMLTVPELAAKGFVLVERAPEPVAA